MAKGRLRKASAYIAAASMLISALGITTPVAWAENNNNLYLQNFENVELTDLTYSLANNTTARMLTDTAGNSTTFYNYYTSGASGDRASTLSLPQAYGAGVPVSFSILARIMGSNTNASQFELHDSSGVALFKFKANSYVGSPTINGEAVTLTTSNIGKVLGASDYATTGWLKFEGTVNFGASNKMINLTVTDTTNGNAVIYSKRYSTTATNIKTVYGSIGRSNGAFAFDDIVITQLEASGEPSQIELTGGSEYVYKPASGTNVSEQFIATVLDDSGKTVDDAEVEWSITGDTAGCSIADGIVSVTSTTGIGDFNGKDIKVIAKLKSDPTIYSEATLHIRDVAALGGFDIVGGAAIKDGTSVTYSVANIVDQYGEPFSAELTPTITSSNKNVTVNGMTVTANTGVVNRIPVTLTATANGVSVEKVITVYGINYYEPGIDEISNATGTRFADVDGEYTLIWPKAGGTTEITLPTAVEFTKDSSKIFSFDNVIKTQNAGQWRYLQLYDSKGQELARLNWDYYAVKIYNSAMISETTIGSLPGLDTACQGSIAFRLNDSGLTEVTAVYNGGTPVKYTLGEGIKDIKSYKLSSQRGALPDERLLTLTSIKVIDSTVADVEISGDTEISKVSGGTARKTYEGYIYSSLAGETYSWAVTDANGNAVPGASISSKGVLSIADSCTAGSVEVRYVSSLDNAKYASKTVAINGYSTVSDFTLNGTTAINIGEKTTFTVSDITDINGDSANEMPVTWSIVSGSEYADINASTGVLTANAGGDITVQAEVGNPGTTKLTKTFNAHIGYYYYINKNVSGDSLTVNVAGMEGSPSAYRVTTAGTQVNSYETNASNGSIEVDTTGATAVEVSPIYIMTSVGDARNGKSFTVADGRYDVTVKKSNGNRSDVCLNGYIIGNNVDQYGAQRSSSGSEYTAYDTKCTGGTAIVSTSGYAGSGYLLDSIKLSKSPSIVTRKPHLYVLGDSLVATYYGAPTKPDANGVPEAGTSQTGWGQMLNSFIKDSVTVTNLAESGSTGTSLYNSVWKTVISMAEPGDVALYECGYNDTSRDTSSMTPSMTAAFAEAQAKGVTLIFVTPNASVHDFKSSPSMADTVRSTANSIGCPYIDLSALSFAYYNEKGKDYTKKNFNVYNEDTLHSAYFGALKCAQLVATAMKDIPETAYMVKGASFTLTDSNGEELVITSGESGPEPTATPTAEPTATPTAEPTATPTAEPTATPTAEPTATPTAEPTATPTAVPTAAPINDTDKNLQDTVNDISSHGIVTITADASDQGEVSVPDNVTIKVDKGVTLTNTVINAKDEAVSVELVNDDNTVTSITAESVTFDSAGKITPSDGAIMETSYEKDGQTVSDTGFFSMTNITAATDEIKYRISRDGDLDIKEHIVKIGTNISKGDVLFGLFITEIPENITLNVTIAE